MIWEHQNFNIEIPATTCISEETLDLAEASVTGDVEPQSKPIMPNEAA